jgi:hypothetical protein
MHGENAMTVRRGNGKLMSKQQWKRDVAEAVASGRNSRSGSAAG